MPSCPCHPDCAIVSMPCCPVPSCLCHPDHAALLHPAIHLLLPSTHHHRSTRDTRSLLSSVPTVPSPRAHAGHRGRAWPLQPQDVAQHQDVAEPQDVAQHQDGAPTAQPRPQQHRAGHGRAERLPTALLPGGRRKPGLARDLAALLSLTFGSSAPACRARALRWPRPPRRVKGSVLKTCTGLSRLARAPAQWQHPDLGARHPAAPRGCLTGPQVLLPHQRHVPAVPAAPHRKSERAGGEIIQSRAEKSLNLISVGHGHNQISPARWNIVSMFPQAG